MTAVPGMEGLSRAEAEALLKSLSTEDLLFLEWQQKWRKTARPEQIPPKDGWSEMGIQAGRGAGKTRVGSEWIGKQAYRDPEALPRAVIAPTLNDIRFTCFEGHSGLLSVVPPELVKDYNKTNLQITLVNGATIRGFSAEEPERLRGPQHAAIWGDELCLVAGTKIATARGQRSIENVQAGDLVITRKGLRRVVRAWKTTDFAEVWEVTLSDRRKLVGTAGHPVWVDGRGFSPLSSLLLGCKIPAWNINQELAGTDKTGGFGLTITKTAKGNCSTGKNTSLRTDRFRQTWTFITSMGTVQTTILRICRRLREATTFENTRLAVSSRLQLSNEDGSPSTTGKSNRQKHSVAFNAMRRLSLPQPARNIAPLIADTKRTTFQGNENRALQPSPEFESRKPELAWCAQPLSESVPIHGQNVVPEAVGSSIVVGLKRLPTKAPVYNLEVEDEHEYFANGILTHNCSWVRGEDTWDMAKFGLRLGPNPQILWTTTPKPKDLIRKLTTPKPGRVIVRGSTYDNRANLPDSFFEDMKQYEGTQLGRQELEGELIDGEEGGIISRSWFKLWPAKSKLPHFEWIVMSLDTAFTEKTLDKRTHTADSSACTVWGVFYHEDIMQVMLLDCWSEQLGFPDLIKRTKRELNVAYGDDDDQALIKPMFGSDKPMTSGRKPDILIIEDKGSGISLRQSLEREGIDAYKYNPGRADKLTRLHMVSHIFAKGLAWLPESDKYPGRPRTWVEPMLAQLCSFTGSGSIKHDDFVDSVSQCIRLLVDKNFLTAVKREKKEYKDEYVPKKPVVNPYAI